MELYLKCLKPQDIAKNVVLDYAVKHPNRVTDKKLSLDDIEVVWYTIMLNNWKALLNLSDKDDDRYFELSYDHTANTVNVDVFVKYDEHVVSI